jgi:hypothetical protein
MERISFILFLIVSWLFCISSGCAPGRGPATVPDPAMTESPATWNRWNMPLGNQHGAVQMSIRGSWEFENDPKHPKTTIFSPKSGPRFKILLTPLLPKDDAAPPDTVLLKEMVQDKLNALKPQAVERDPQILEMKGSQGRGYYFSVTDRAPKPDEFKFVTQGMIRGGDLTLYFTILTNEGQENVIEDALTMFKGAKYIASASIGQNSEGIRNIDGKYRISKGSDLWFEFPSSDFKVDIERHAPDGKSDYYMLTSKSRKLNVSFTIEPASK